VIGLALAVALQVGSKQFTESVILAEIAVQALRSAGVEADHRRELGGTRVLWEALRARQIDFYPEYTGTIVEELLGGERDFASALDRLGMRAGGGLGFEDTYAIGMRRLEADRLGIRSLSDLARHRQLEIGLTNEFVRRRDGWPRLRQVYGFSDAHVRGMQHELAYRALRSGGIAATDLIRPTRRSRRAIWSCSKTIAAPFPATTPCCCAGPTSPTPRRACWRASKAPSLRAR